MIPLPIETERLLIRPLRLDDAAEMGQSRDWIQEKIERFERDGGMSLWAVVERASSRTSELGRRDPAHPAVDTRLGEDRLRELGPCAVAVGGDVPHAARKLDELAHRGAEMSDVCRAASLVVDDGDLVSFRAGVEHRPHEVRPRLAEEP